MQVVQDDRRLLERIGGVCGQALVSTAAAKRSYPLMQRLSDGHCTRSLVERIHNFPGERAILNSKWINAGHGCLKLSRIPRCN